MGIVINGVTPSGFAINGKTVAGLAKNGIILWRMSPTLHPWNSFADATWEEIDYVANTLGIAEQIYSIHDTKTDANGIEFEIADFSHDPLADGSGFAAISLVMTGLTVDTYAMNATKTNVGGWDECTLRNDTIPEIKTTLFSDALRSVVKIVNKPTGIGGNNNATVADSADDFWLLSNTEITGDPNYSENYSSVEDGTQYPIFANADWSRVVKYSLRSPRVGNSAAFLQVTASGEIMGNAANKMAKIALGCCI